MMASVVGDALRRKKEEETRRKIERAARIRAEERMSNKSGGDIGGAIGTGAGIVGALATGNPGAIPAAASVGRSVGSMAGKALDPDEDVTMADTASAAVDLASARKDKDAMKFLNELLGRA
jgi:hypothetical protein|tara:strand:+ start:2200 stop:2562 length:363 start_codon:yes stop_codon:yes gene_type:complete